MQTRIFLMTLATALLFVGTAPGGNAADTLIGNGPTFDIFDYEFDLEGGEDTGDTLAVSCCHPVQLTGNEIICALMEVEQGVATGVNSDCILLPFEEVCVHWSYLFEVPTAWYDVVSGAAGGRFYLYLDIVPEFGTPSHLEQPISGNVLPDLNALRTDDAADTETIEDSDIICFDPPTGMYGTTAEVWGRYKHQQCFDECVVIDEVPHNKEKYPGTMISGDVDAYKL